MEKIDSNDIRYTDLGAPIPNEQTAGSMINQPDTDLADPAWNESDVPGIVR